MQVKLNFVEIKNEEWASPNSEITTLNSATLIPIGKSGIHIKKKNRGSFTEYCGGKVTDACIQKAKNSPSSAIRKKAVFAENARGWARKHQEGGKLNHLPGIGSTYLSSVFVDLDEAPDTYAQVTPTWQTKPRFEISEDFTTSEPIKDITPEKKETTETSNPGIPSWLTTPYAGYRNYNPENDRFFGSGTFGSGVSKELKASIQKYLGVPYEERNCSQFVSAVLKDMGRKESGNSQALWRATQRIGLKDLRPGDLVFLDGTIPGRAKGEASHVAIVTDTSKLAEGKLGIAHSGGKGQKSMLKTWDLNKIKNFLGAGRLV